MVEDLRHRARILVLQALYQIDVGHQPWDEAIANVLREEMKPSMERLVWAFTTPSLHAGPVATFWLAWTLYLVDVYVSQVTRGVWEHREAIDRLIQDKARNWKLERMARVDRNILRLGTYELLHRPAVPPAVVLNEAVEMAKEYGDEGSGSFVNGILDAVRATEVRSE